MIRTFRDYLDDILTCFVETQEFIQGLNFDDFARDRKTINAVVRSLEVMGEAAKRIPAAVREKYPDIPWKRMAGMRGMNIRASTSKLFGELSKTNCRRSNPPSNEYFKISENLT